MSEIIVRLDSLIMIFLPEAQQVVMIKVLTGQVWGLSFKELDFAMTEAIKAKEDATP